MHIIGEVHDDAPLVVVAVEEEAVAFPDDLAYLITGPGKVNAAIAVAYVLARVRPSIVINVGTAGALHEHLEGLHDIASVSQHDLDLRALEKLTGRAMEHEIDLGRAGLRLVTGDLFVSDVALRDRLAQHADLVDMEGFAVAATAKRFGVPARLIKYVSDTADETAMRDWPSQTRVASAHLARWLVTEL
jgi:adenosylhomocysteine nucleosidase